MSKYVCTDVGGTFTDAAVIDENGEMRVFKSPTTHDDYAKGIIGALNLAAEYWNQPMAEFMASCSLIDAGVLTHGSTIATNAVLEGRVDKVGMIVTKGHRDVLLWREGPVKDPFDFQLDYPEPYIPRYLTLPVEERINAEGGIETPLNVEEVKKAVLQLKEWDVKAIAICLLWSVANPIHEQQAAKIAKEVWPECEVVISSVVNPCIREYRRWVSTAMDASLKRIISTYTKNLNDRLRELGFKGEVGMLNSSGGVSNADEISARPLYSIDSGPALAPIAGRKISEADLGIKDVVILDMGGTSFDVSCVLGGEVSVTREAKIGWEIPGISRVNVHSIGAGGGSIAWVDSGGMCRVGPKSAGSNPGPACYNWGGTKPTVTDANVVLGYIDPDYFNGGRMQLHKNFAEKAIKEHVADPMGLSIEEAAFTIWTTVNANMVAAIKEITIWQGIDPRDYVMVSGGGAGGVHTIPLADGLEMKKILIPKTAGALSATGGIFSNVVSENSRSFYTETREPDFEQINLLLKELAQEATDFFDRNNIAENAREYRFYMEGRYPFQVWEIPIRIDGYMKKGFILDEDGLKKMVERFHEEHDRMFAVKEEDAYVECIFWRVEAVGQRKEILAKQIITEVKANEEPAENALMGKRKAYFRDLGGMVETNIYQGDLLTYGNRIYGPAIIEEDTTTISILPGYEAKVTKFSTYFIKKKA
ncbi:hydantoinase/oxoprolinase family protein [Desulfotignum balticum]|uniref:hydantoinase/oxoprolinase family protein n=1 Tax=Desulfotignum balticum TaxID=115781 RepID=UPI0004068AE5|nr:hydantoinase/oxoprolinase family protein [Desulfotignum balticum]